MKREWIRNLIGLALLVALVLYVSWQRKSSYEASQKTDQEKKLLDFDPGLMAKIVVKNNAGTVVFAKRPKAGGGTFTDEWAPLSAEDDSLPDWAITEPVRSLPDEYTMRTLLDNIKGLEETKVIDEKGSRPEEYGLKSPRLQIELYAPGKPEARLGIHVGDQNSAHTGLYLKTSQGPKIVLTPMTLDYLMTRNPNDWRRKEIWGAKDVKKVKSLQAEYLEKGKRSGFSLRREASGWKILGGTPLDADERTMDSFLNEMRAVRATDFVSENGERDAKKFGLDHPFARIRIGMEGPKGFVDHVLLVGQKSEKDKDLYVRRTDFPQIYAVTSSAKNTYRRSLADLIDKHPLALDENKIDHVWVTTKGATTQVEKSENRWVMKQPVADDADTSETEGLLSKLVSLRGQEYIPEGKVKPAGNPLAVFKISAAGSQREVKIYEMQKQMYGVRSEPKVTFRFAESDVNEILSKPEMLRERRVVPFSGADLKAFSLKKAKLEVRLERDEKGAWKLEALEGADAAIRAKLSKRETTEAFAREISDLRLDSFSAATASPAGAPTLELSVASKAGKSLSWRFGPGAEGQKVRGWCKERKVQGLVSKQGLENVEKFLAVETKGKK
ncbi:MAG: DUF4340 domain-containing protein [Pseudomonadota bacterium]